MQFGRYEPVFLDIETYATEDPVTLKVISESVQHPKSMKKAETIAKWEAESKPAAVASAINRTALDGTYGRVGAVAVKLAGQLTVLHDEQYDEAALLSRLAVVLESCSEAGGFFASSTGWALVGFNVLGFDLPFLVKRYVVNGLEVPQVLRVDTKPWSKQVVDVMLRWDSGKYIGQSELARVLGIEVPLTLPGEKIPAAIATGEWEQVIEHVRADVEVLEALHGRLGACGMLDF